MPPLTFSKYLLTFVQSNLHQCQFNVFKSIMGMSQNYLDWNDRITTHFFRSEMAGRPVHLYVTEELIESFDVGKLNDFIDSVKEGPPWVSSSLGICQKAYRTLKNWREIKSLQYPPYIAYLALFVLAAGIEGDFAAHAYYPRLRILLGEPPGSTLPSFKLMLDLWDDLEVWSNQDKQGELGVFNIQIAGNRIHIGLPIAQTVLTEHERRFLPAIFAEAELDPLSPPSDTELMRLFQKHGSQKLRRRTLHLLEHTHDEADLREFLLQTIRDELEIWDGRVEEIGDEVAKRLRRGYGNLRICLNIDRTAGKAKASLRCCLNRDFPDEGLQLKSRISGETFAVEECLPGWSYPLISAENGSELDAAMFDWDSGVQFEDEEHGWRFRLPGNPIRIFISGKHQGFSGLIEVRQLPRSHKFYLAARSECSQQIVQWGNAGCQGFQETEITTGLPPDWRLYSAEKALTDQPIRERYPLLSFSSTIRLLLRHGIRSSRGNHFFYFAPPDVILEGGEGNEKVFCNDTELGYDSDKGVYILPMGLPADHQLRIKVKRGDDNLKQRSFWLTREFNSKWFEPLKFANKFGDEKTLYDSSDSSLAGAFLNNATLPQYQFQVCPQLFNCQRAYFVGKMPGQIVSWPVETLPEVWTPVWAIAMTKKRGNAIFCGPNLDSVQPVIDRIYDHKKIKLWKEVLWYWRKRVSEPEHPSARKLWNEYQEAARRV